MSALADAFLALPPRRNPHAAAAGAHVDAWVGGHGLVQREAVRLRFAETDFGAFAAATYPAADAPGLELVTDWLAWLFLLDDLLDDGALGRSPEQLSALLTAIMAVLAGRAPEAGAAPIVHALDDLWRRTAPGTGEVWRHRFTGHATQCALAVVWEVDNRVRGVVPSEAEYLERRRHTGAIYPCMDLIEVVEGIELPDAVYRSGPFTRALDAACDVVCWTNDLVSLDKEVALGEYHNLVVLLEHWRGIDRGDALELGRARAAERLREFHGAEAEVLAAHHGHRAELATYLAGMRSWMRGHLDWSASSGRYRLPVTDAVAGERI
ncbi:terpene synthase family protein [Nocardia asteroides]|uniref:terpene synthase family protein n=1 Tax=Nocardia asteroides TaxID=1824 RepID=UPI001E2D2251|nr:hypothetical protein [Nocardia asteroides]UGT62210.1 hypothetical protein LTT61_02345 [Nocardia asteroides]